MELKRDWRWGARTGLIFGTLYSLYALLLYAIRGDRPFAENGTTLARAIAAYYAGGLVGGVVLGVLRPIAITLGGAIVIGVVAFLAIMAGAGMAAFGPPWRWGVAEVVTLLITASIFGVTFGAYGWHRFVRPDRHG